MDEAQQVAVDIADIEGHGLGPAAQRDPAIGVGEQQQRRTGRVRGVTGLQLIGKNIGGSKWPYSPELGGVVPAVHAGGSAGEAPAAEFIILEPAQIGVHPPRRGAFSQVNEGFHDGSQGRSKRKTEGDISFRPPL